MRRVVINNQMQVQVGRRFRIDFLQELDPFLMSMSRHAFGDNSALRQFDCSEQGRGSVSFIVVCQRLQSARVNRQALLRAIERLNLTFLINTERQRFLRRVEIETHNVGQFLQEPGIA